MLLTRGVHYELTLDTAGAVTATPLSLPPAPGTLRFERQTPATQETPADSAWTGEVLETAFDAAAMRDAELRRDIALSSSAEAIAAALAAAASADEAEDWRDQAAEFAGELSVGVFLTGGFTGNGVTTAFDLGYPIVLAARVLWVEGGVLQRPGTDFTIAGNIVTRTSAPGNAVPIFWVLLGEIEETGDQHASGIANDSGVTGATIKDALDWLAANKQNLAANLTALAALSGVADRLAYFTGAGALALATLTSFARTLIDDANQAAAQATLGIGTAGLQDIATAAQYRAATANKILAADAAWGAAALVALTDAATIAVDMSTFFNATVTLGGNRTLGNPSNTKVGQSGIIYVVQDGTGSRTLAYAANYKFGAGVAPTLSTAIGAVDRLTYFVRTSTHIDIDISKARA